MRNYDTPDGWDMEREEADRLQAHYEAEGRRYARRQALMERLRDAGDREGAARACAHGGGYPLNSPAARNEKDPRAGEPGYRCSDCYSVLDRFPWDGPPAVLHPCEERPK